MLLLRNVSTFQLDLCKTLYEKFYQIQLLQNRITFSPYSFTPSAISKLVPCKTKIETLLSWKRLDFGKSNMHDLEFSCDNFKVSCNCSISDTLSYQNNTAQTKCQNDTALTNEWNSAVLVFQSSSGMALITGMELQTIPCFQTQSNISTAAARCFYAFNIVSPESFAGHYVVIGSFVPVDTLFFSNLIPNHTRPAFLHVLHILVEHFMFEWSFSFTYFRLERRTLRNQKTYQIRAC